VKRLFIALRYPIDLIFAVLAVPAALVLLMYRKYRSVRLPLTTSVLRKIGIFPIENHYYEPLFDHRLIRESMDKPRNLPGIDLNEPGQLALLEKLTYAPELVALRLDQKSDSLSAFQFNNGSFESGDAEFLYQMVRHLKPAKVIEIGSGFSTKIARLALLKNREEGASQSRHICVEPYEMPWLETLGDIETLRERVEDCKIDWSQELVSGDVLFVDSSHMIRPQGDVLKEYLEIFPVLQSGVIVHVHDIFTPRDYLTNWIVKDVKFWNEQYLLEAVLANTARYEVLAGLDYLTQKYFNKMKSVCPYLTVGRRPGSFYFRVR
jgi:Methyltransferase domain